MRTGQTPLSFLRGKGIIEANIDTCVLTESDGASNYNRRSSYFGGTFDLAVPQPHSLHKFSILHNLRRSLKALVSGTLFQFDSGSPRFPYGQFIGPLVPVIQGSKTRHLCGELLEPLDFK